MSENEANIRPQELATRLRSLAAERAAAEGSLAAELASKKQAAEKQQVKAPGLPPGATFDLEKFIGEGSGTTHVSVNNIVPKSKVSLAGRRTVTFVSRVRINGGQINAVQVQWVGDFSQKVSFVKGGASTMNVALRAEGD